MAIYQARFNKYLSDRGIKDVRHKRVWAFLGDGECDEPETLGAITLASREQLDNLTFVINWGRESKSTTERDSRLPCLS
jgi:pyruvate dehydrogenase E1 component